METTLQKRSRALGRMLARLDRQGDGPDLSLGELADEMRQLGPLYLMMAIAAVAVSPLSGVPFVTAICGLSIAGLATQLLLRRRVVWLPESLRTRRLPVARLRNGLARADRVVIAVERLMRRRLTWLTNGPVRVTLLSLCVAFGLIMPFMEVVPFAGSTVASLVLIISLALISRDGVVALVAGLAICGVVTTAATLIF